MNLSKLPDPVLERRLVVYTQWITSLRFQKQKKLSNQMMGKIMACLNRSQEGSHTWTEINSKVAKRSNSSKTDRLALELWEKFVHDLHKSVKRIR
jgi:hypothetical protein